MSKITNIFSKGLAKASSCALLVIGMNLTAQQLEVVGVLGNSGEQGETLVRYSDKASYGIGVVYDRFGTLWTNSGEQSVNRYTVDGRQVGVYNVGKMGGRLSRDKVVLVGNTLVFKLGYKLYTLPDDAPDGAEATELPIRADRIAFNTNGGDWIYGSKDGEIFRFNLAGERESIQGVEGGVKDLELGGDGEVYVQSNWTLQTLNDPDTEIKSPGEKFQFLNGQWYGNAWHGTLRRFDDDFEMNPGVVLGGNSGSFIGYVPGNYELCNGQGMAYLGDHIYAISGFYNVLHLMRWQPEVERFEIIRRIGAVDHCNALAIDSKGDVWHHGGVWHWDDGPAAPLVHGIPWAGAPSGGNDQGKAVMAATVLDGDIMVGVGPYGDDRGILFSGPLDKPIRRNNMKDDLMKGYVSMAALRLNNRTAVLLMKADGSGVLRYVNRGNGQPQEVLGDVQLKTTTPISTLYSVAAGEDNDLWVAADGAVILLKQQGQEWAEVKRWAKWRNDDHGAFGQRLYLDYSDKRLWVTDTERNRILVFNVADGALMPFAAMGETDVAGDSLNTFDKPAVVACNGARAVVFDSANQRIIKFQLSE